VGSSDLDTRRVLAGTVERGKNPEDGTDESLATLVPREPSQEGTRRKEGAPDVKAFVGARTPREAVPARPWNDTSLLGGAGRRRGEREEAKPGTLERHRTPRGQLVGLSFRDKA